MKENSEVLVLFLFIILLIVQLTNLSILFQIYDYQNYIKNHISIEKLYNPQKN